MKLEQLHTDDMILALFEQAMKNDPEFKQEQYRASLKDKISIAWLDQAHSKKLFRESVSCVVTTTDGHSYGVRVPPMLVKEDDIQVYMDEVVNPQAINLVDMITKDYPDLSDDSFDIKSVELSKIFRI